MADCVFCEILVGNLPVSWVFQDDEVVAFMTIGPVNPGHVLVIPRQHAAQLADLDPAIGGKIFQGAMRVAAAIRASSLPSDGINLFVSDGPAAGQEVFHVHLHVVPRVAGDRKIRLVVPEGMADRAALEAAAEQIKANLP